MLLGRHIRFHLWEDVYIHQINICIHQLHVFLLSFLLLAINIFLNTSLVFCVL